MNNFISAQLKLGLGLGFVKIWVNRSVIRPCISKFSKVEGGQDSTKFLKFTNVLTDTRERGHQRLG